MNKNDLKITFLKAAQKLFARLKPRFETIRAEIEIAIEKAPAADIPHQEIEMMRQFILELKPEDIEPIDQLYLSDPNYPISCLEVELIQDYLHGRLSEQERAAFREGYINSPHSKDVEKLISFKHMNDFYRRIEKLENTRFSWNRPPGRKGAPPRPAVWNRPSGREGTPPQPAA